MDIIHSLSYLRLVEFFDLTSHNDGHNDSINRDGFAENDADQILGPDSGGFDTSSDDARTGRVDSGSGADH